MTTSLTTLPPSLRGNTTVQGLVSSLEKAKGQNRSLRSEVKEKVGLGESVAATAIGAALSGYLKGRGHGEGTVGGLAAACVVGGVLLGQPALVHAGNGAAAPLVAAWAESLGRSHVQASSKEAA